MTSSRLLIRTMMRERTHSNAPIVTTNTVNINVSISNVEVLLDGTTRPDTWIMKKVGTSMRALTKKLKKPTEKAAFTGFEGGMQVVVGL